MNRSGMLIRTLAGLVLPFLVSASLAADMTVTNGLQLWLKADAITGLSDGAAVTNWPDASGLTNDVAQSTAANQPLYTASALNGKPVVRFDGADDRLERSDALGFTNNPAMTVIVVAQVDTLGALKRMVCLGEDVSTGGRTIGFCADTSTRYNNGNKVWSNNSFLGGFKIGAWLCAENETYEDTAFYQDGVGPITKTTGGAVTTKTLSDEKLRIGAKVGQNSEFFDGDIAEILIYDRVLTIVELESTGAHLEEKYGLDTAYGDTPGDITGLALWLDADRLGYNDGETVTQWTDFSTNANHATNSAGPVYVADAIGGRGAVSFNVGTGLYTGTLTADWPTNETSVFIVSKADNTTQQTRFFQARPDETTNRFGCNLPYNNTAYFDVGDRSGDGRISTAYNGGTNFNIWHLRSEDGVGQAIYRNGMLEASDTTADIFSPTGQILWVADNFLGDIAEVIIYNRVLTTNEAIAVGYYLEEKYGLETVYPDPESVPMQLGGARLWLDYGAMPGLVQGSQPATIYDSSGHEHDLALSDGAPTYNESGFNGMPFMDYGGGGAYTRSVDGLGFSANPAITVAVVMQSDNSGTDAFMQIGSTAGSGYQIINWMSEASVRYNNGNKVFNESFAGAVSVGIFTRKAGDSYDDVRLFKDGREIGQKSAANGARLPTLLDQKTTVGRGWNTSGNPANWFAGNMYELIVFDKELTYDEQNTLGGYLAEKYGVTTTYSGDVDPNGFAHEMNISFPGYDRSDVLTNFPVLVELSESIDGFTHAQLESPAGYDLRFTDSTGTNLLAHDIDEWAAAPVAAWSFNASLSDVSVVGDGYTGTINGGVTYTNSTPDGSGKALAFNGTDGYVSISGFKGVAGQTPRTMSAWIRNAGPEEGIMGWGTDAAGQKWNMRADLGTGRLRVDVNGGYVIGTTVLTNTADTSWHHIAAVFPEGADNVTDVRLYVDGAEESISGSAGELIKTASGADVRIGVGHNSHYFGGQIDEVAIFDRVLSGAQIAELHNSGSPQNTGGRLNGGVSHIWVRVPELERGTTIKALWGRGEIADEPPFTDVFGLTWSEGFEGVWHVESTSTEDATEYARDTAASGTVTPSADAPVGSGAYYDTANAWSQATSYKGILGTASRTLSAWSKRTAAADNDSDIMSWGKNTGGQKWVFRVQDDNPGTRNLRVEVNGGWKVGTTDLGDDQWHHVAVVYDNALAANVTSLVFYVDGVDDGSLGNGARAFSTVTDRDLRLGGEGWSTGRSLHGYLDDARLSSVARSAAWLNTEYLTVAENATFTSYEKVFNVDEFDHRMKIEFAYDKGEVLTNFPALVKLDPGTNLKYGDLLSTSGWDLRFTDATGTDLLAYEIEDWDTNGTSYVWVRIPTFTNNTAIWAAWGDTGFAVQQPYTTNGAVWNPDYRSVWHMAESSGTHSDSTTNAIASTAISVVDQDAEGRVAGADRFNGTSDYVSFNHGSKLNLSGTLTYEAIVRWDGAGDAYSRVFANILSGANYFDIHVNDGSVNGLYRTRYKVATVNRVFAPGYNLTAGRWCHLSVVWDGSNRRMYADGVQVGSDTWGPGDSGDGTLFVGANNAAGANNFHGIVDEMRISSVGRSSNWIWAAHQNVADYDAFVTHSPQVRADAATLIAATSAQANGELVWTAGTNMDVTVYYGTVDQGATTVGWDGSQSVGTGLAAGSVLTTSLAGLQPDTTVYYRFYATDGSNEAWSEVVNLHTLIADIPGLVLWVNADAILDMTNGGTVDTWHDLSGNANDLERHIGTPVYMTNAVNGRPVVRFDGNDNNYYDFDRISDIRTVIWVVREDAAASGSRFLLGDDATYHFHRGADPDNYIWHSGNAAAAIRNGSTYVNGIVVNGTATAMPTNISIIALQTAGNVEANRLSRDRNQAGRNWQGDVAELLIYNRVLTDVEMDEVGSHLAQKYDASTSYSAPIDPADFAHSLTIEFPGYDRSGTLTNFPALMVLGEHIDGFDYAEFASVAGNDLRFTDSTGTNTLFHEIEEWAMSVPMAAWDFEGDANDVSIASNGWDGTLFNSAAYSADTPSGTGQSLQLDDATTDHVQFTGFKGVLGANPRSLAVWIKGPEANDTIFSWGTNIGGKKWIMRVNNNATGALRIEVNGGYVIGTTSLRDGNWHHVAAVFPDGGSDVLDVQLYVDGQLEAISGSLGEPIDTASRDVWLGRGHNENNYTGLMDDAAIWDVALSARQIAALYNDGTTPDISRGGASGNSYVWVQVPELQQGASIQAHWGNSALAADSPRYGQRTWDEDFLGVWHMQTAATSARPDATTNGFNTTSQGGKPPMNDGVVGRGNEFDGSAEKLEVAYEAALNPGTPFTYSIWARSDNGSSWRSPMTSRDGTPARGYLFYEEDTTENWSAWMGDGAGFRQADSVDRTVGLWEHLCAVYDGSALKMYVNGSYASQANYTISPNTAQTLKFGAGGNTGTQYYFNGGLDEARVEGAARSADWVWAAHKTVAKNSGFTQYGPTLDPADFAHRMKIVFDGYEGATTLTDFPALVQFAETPNFSYADFASTNGWDLRFTDSAGTNRLFFEIEEWNPGGTSYVWVQVPQFQHNTAIWAYWGNSGLPDGDPSRAGTWASDYQIVWHLTEANASDSTGYGRDGTASGSADATALIGTGQEFTSDTLTHALQKVYSEYTLSVWTRAASGGQANYSGVFNTGTLGQDFQLDVDGSTPGSYRYHGDEASGRLFGTESVKVGDWVQLTIKCNGQGGLTKLYYNGVEADSFTASDVNFGRHDLGQNRGSGTFFNGTYDEFRIAEATHSADWILATYQNVARTAEFMSHKAMIHADPATSVAVNTATANGTLSWDGGLSTDVKLLWGTSDGGAALGSWDSTNDLGAMAVGSTNAALSGLAADTTYFYRFYATNTADEAWSDTVASFHTLLSDIPNLQLWVSADAITGVTNGGTVTTWYDLSGNDNHLRLWGDDPQLITNAANGQSVVRFDGADEEHFTFDRISDIRTVIWVIKEDSGATGAGFVLGDNGSTYHFHRDTLTGTNFIWHATLAHANIRNGATVLNGAEIDGTATEVPTSLSIITLVTAGDVQANTLVNDRFIDGRAWDGDIAELMVFNRALSVGELNEIGQRFATKYGIAASYTSPVLDPHEFTHRMKMKFDGYTGGSTLQNFPVLVRLGEHINGFTYDGFVATNGMDIRFADESETQALSFEIDEWDTNGYSTIWVRVPEVNASSYVWAYWGNSVAATNPPFDYGEGVWDGDYDGVWHLRNDLADATSHSIDGTGSNLTSAAGMISSGQDFDGFQSTIVLNDDARLEHANGVTVEGWINNSTLSGVQRIFYKNPGYSFGINGDRLRFTTHSVKDYQSATGVIEADRWHHIAGVLNASDNVRFYVDGQYIGNATHGTSGNTGASTAYIGRWDAQFWAGMMDDVRVSGTVRSDDWIEATYATVASNTTFSTYELFVTADRASSIAETSATLEGTVHFTNGTPTYVTLYYGTGDGGASEGGWSVTNDLGTENGSFAEPVSSLSPQTTYYFRFYASNDTFQAWSGVQAFRTLIDGVDGIALWLDADEVTGKSNGESVQTWRDLSGNAKHAVQFVGERKPVYTASALGSKPAVTFASGDTMDLLASVAGSGSTVFIVHRQNVFQSAVTHVLGGTLNTTQGDQQWALDGDGVGIDIFPPITSTNFSVNVMQLVPRYFRLWVNGTMEDPSTVNATLDPFSSVGYDFEGDVAEVIVFNRQLSANEQNAIGKYLGAKYGVSTSYENPIVDPGSYNYNATITYNYDKGALTNFPALVKLNSSTIPEFSKDKFESTAGYDLRFTDDTGTNALSFEYEKLLREVPVAYYTFESNAVDVSTAGNAHNGSLLGDAMYTNDTPSGSGWALNLKGTNGYVQIPGWKGISGQRARTISAWIKLEESSPTNAGIVAWGQDASGEKWNFRVQDSNGTSGAIRIEENGNYEVGSTPVNTGVWHHVAVVLHDGGNGGVDPVLFVDGAMEAQSAGQASQTINTDINDGIQVLIGNDHANNRFEGLIDEVAIWEAALTPAQIATVYNGGTPLDVSGGLDNDEIIAWVQVPAFTNNCRIQAYWGGVSAGNKPPFYAGNSAVWDSRFEGVYHMTSRDPQDKTVFARHQTNSGELTYTNSIVHVGQNFPGDAHATLQTAIDEAYAQYAVSVWVNAATTNLTVNRSSFNCGANASDFQFDSDGSYDYRLASDVGNALFGPIQTNWVNLVMTATGANMLMYYDGRYVNQVAGHVNDFDRFDIGSNRARDQRFQGVIDEVRVMNVAPASNWVWASYITVASNDTFSAYGALEGPAPAPQNLAATLITDTNAIFNGYLSVTDDVPCHVWMVWGTNDGLGAWGAWDSTNDFGSGHVSGPLATNIAGLTRITKYYYAFVASNQFGVGWAQPSTNFRTLDVYFTITPSNATYGTISPDIAENVNQGSNSTVYTFQPNVGFHLTNVLVDATLIGVTNQYQFVDVQTNHGIQPLFGINSYTITVNQVAGGTIAPDPADTVVHTNDSQVFTLTPARGYYLCDTIVDSVS